jgi:hypothetical protein
MDPEELRSRLHQRLAEVREATERSGEAGGTQAGS